jgi:hypothetical protein
LEYSSSSPIFKEKNLIEEAKRPDYLSPDNVLKIVNVKGSNGIVMPYISPRY